MGHVVRGAILGHGGVAGEGGTAEDAQVNGHDDVPSYAEVGGDALGGSHLDIVTLAVAEGQGVDFIAFGLGDGQRRGGVEAAAEKHHGAK